MSLSVMRPLRAIRNAAHNTHLGVMCYTRLLDGVVLDYEQGVYDTGWAKFETVSLVALPISSLFVDYYGLGPVKVTATPHYSFVEAYLAGRLPEKHEWHEYQRAQHKLQTEQLLAREMRFKALIDRFISATGAPQAVPVRSSGGQPRESIGPDESQFEILVRLSPRGAFVRDGFHRLAIMAQMEPAPNVSCRVMRL